MSKYKIVIYNSIGLHVDWPGSYKRQTHAERAAQHLRKKFSQPFWRTYYEDISPKVIKNE